MNNIYDNHIPPNFLNSILTNDGLYKMFKDDFETNKDYFQNISKDTYIVELENYICSSLSNYNKDTFNLNCFKRFYDDFILTKIETQNEYIFITSLFKTLKKLYISNNYNDESFLSFYNYIFSSSHYFDRCDEIIDRIKSEQEIRIVDYEILTNYVKNSVLEYLPMEVTCLLIKNHIYKYNHIFDSEVVKKIILSVAHDYLKKYGIKINVLYNDVILAKNIKTHDINTSTIYIDSILIDTFISGNYIELLSSLFYKLTLFKDDYLTKNNIECLDTLYALWRFVNCKVEIDKIFLDTKYQPYDYYSEMETNAFIMTLRFLDNMGISLFNNYLNSQIRDLDFSTVDAKNSPKEIPEEMKFINRFSKMEREKIKAMREKYRVLSYFYGSDGKRYKAIELFSKCDNEHKYMLFDYISLIIPEPIYLIDDITDIINQNFNDKDIDDFILKIIKYIYPDVFYYSLDAYLIMNENKTSFNKNEYLSELYVRVSSIKETEDIQKFIKSAINAIELMKQKN